MFINTENNKKSDELKFLLRLLTNKLNQWVGDTIQVGSYGYDLDEIEPCIENEAVEYIDKGISIVEDLNRNFQSFNDLGSVKRLREAELYFSKDEYLKNYNFPNYKSYINPYFIAYIDLEDQLNDLFGKANDLFCRGFDSAGNTIHDLIFNFRRLNRAYFEKEEIKYEEYKFRALNIIEEARPILEQQRGYKKILGNLALFISIIGVFAFLVNKVVTGNFLFFEQTDSSKKLDEINNTVKLLNY